MEKELRNQQIQLQTNENKVTGIIKYNIRSQLIGGQFYEVISPGAFQYDTVKALWNHDTNIVLGSTRSNTLVLSDTMKGLDFEIDMPTTRSDIYENIKRGDVDGTSFGMNVLEDTWDYSEQYPVRTILKAELLEISPTPFPAYEGNTISTRALDKAKNIKSEVDNMDNLKKVLEMIAEGKSTDEIKAEIEKMINGAVGADEEKQLRSLLATLKNKSEGRSMNKDEIKAMIKEIRAEEDLMKEIRAAGTQVQVPEVNKIEARSVFKKMINNEKLSNVEMRTISATTGEKGGYLLGEEFHNQIKEYKRQVIDLSQYFNVMPVGSRSGIVPVEVLADMTPMEVVGEGEKNKDGQDPKFTQVKYAVKTMREVYQIANDLIKDQQVDLMGYLARKIAKKDAFSTNYYLLKGFDGKTGLLTNTAFKNEGIALIGLTLTKLKKVINSFDPALRSGMIIITNTDGFSYLSSITYTDGRMAMQEDVTKDSGYTLMGKQIIEMSNKELATDDTKGIPFIFVNPQEAITIFDRQAYEVKASEEAGFDDDVTKVRVIVRKDIVPIDTEACKVLYVKQ